MISVDGILYSGKYCYVVDIVCVQLRQVDKCSECDACVVCSNSLLKSWLK